MSDNGVAQVDPRKINEQIIKLLRDDDFTSLVKRSQQINLFSVVGMENQEIKHSNFLGWLLDPQAPHQLGDAFVKEILVNVFLQSGTAAGQGDEDSSASESISLDEILDNYDDANVARETEDNIDILFRTEDKRLVICIENKVWANLSINQLDKYYDYVKERYNDYSRHVFIFLTPQGRPVPPDYSKHNKEWIPLSYDTIRRSLDNIRGREMSPKTELLIKDYIDLLERNGIVEAESLDQSVNNLYSKYREVFDLIEQRKEGIQRRIRLHLIEIYDEVFAELLEEGTISDCGAAENDNYRYFKTNRMNDYLSAADSSEEPEDGPFYNFWIYPGTASDKFGLLYPKINLEIYPQAAGATDSHGQESGVLTRMRLLAEDEKHGKSIYRGKSLAGHVNIYSEPSGVDEMRTLSEEDVDDDDIKKKIKEEILTMLEYEDSILDKLEHQV